MAAVPTASIPTVAPCPLYQLLLEGRQGIEASFEELHRRTRAQVHAVALQVVRSPDLAADVAQETYLEVWLQAGRYCPERASVLGWITMIARRRAIDRVRSITRAVGQERRYARDAHEPDLLDHAERVAERLDAVQVRPLLAALGPLQREALTLVYLQRRSPQEAADLLGTPLSTLKTRLRDGLLQLRQQVPPPRQPA